MRRERHVPFALVAACAGAPPPAMVLSGEASPTPARVVVAVPPSEAWRREPPASGPIPDPRPAKLHHERLPNGLELYVIERPRWPLLDISLVTRGGAALDPPGKEGLAYLSYSMLGGRSEHMTGIEFAIALNRLGGEFASAAELDHGVVAMTGLARHAEQMAALLAGAVRAPTLDADRLGARREGLEDALAGIDLPAETVVGMRLPPLLFGAKHPYGHPVFGTAASVRTLRISDVRGYVQRHLTPDRSALIIAGALGVAQARALAKKHFGAWRGQGAKLQIPAARAAPRSHVVLVHRPGLRQTRIFVGRATESASSPDAPTLRLMTAAFGGSAASRLFAALRERGGYTYGAEAAVALSPGAGQLLATARVRRTETREALSALLGAFDEMRTRPPSLAELAEVAEREARFSDDIIAETAAEAAGIAGRRFLNGDAPSAPPTAESIARVANEYFERDKLQIVLVGDATELDAIVRELALGTPIVDRR